MDVLTSAGTASFSEGFPHGFPVRPSQIQAEAQDAVTMIAAANDLDDGSDLRIPVSILAGGEDQGRGPRGSRGMASRPDPRSDLQIIPDAGHMIHYAAPIQVAAIDTVSQKAKRHLEPVA